MQSDISNVPSSPTTYGILIQWGVRVFGSARSVQANATTDVNQTFPTTYTTHASCVLLNTHEQAFKASVNNRTLSGFTCTLKNVGNATTTVSGFIWYAIGY